MPRNKKNKGGGGGPAAKPANNQAPTKVAEIPSSAPVAEDNEALKVRLAEAKERLCHVEAVIETIGVQRQTTDAAIEEATNKLQSLGTVVPATANNPPTAAAEEAHNQSASESNTGTAKKNKKHNKNKLHNLIPPEGFPPAPIAKPVQQQSSPKPMPTVVSSEPILAEVVEQSEVENQTGKNKKKNKNKNKQQQNEEVKNENVSAQSKEVVEDIKSVDIKLAVEAAVIAPKDTAPAPESAQSMEPITETSSGDGKKKKNKNKNKNKNKDEPVLEEIANENAPEEIVKTITNKPEFIPAAPEPKKVVDLDKEEIQIDASPSKATQQISPEAISSNLKSNKKNKNKQNKNDTIVEEPQKKTLELLKEDITLEATSDAKKPITESVKPTQSLTIVQDAQLESPKLVQSIEASKSVTEDVSATVSDAKPAEKTNEEKLKEADIKRASEIIWKILDPPADVAVIEGNIKHKKGQKKDTGAIKLDMPVLEEHPADKVEPHKSTHIDGNKVDVNPKVKTENKDTKFETQVKTDSSSVKEKQLPITKPEPNADAKPSDALNKDEPFVKPTYTKIEETSQQKPHPEHKDKKQQKNKQNPPKETKLESENIPSLTKQEKNADLSKALGSVTEVGDTKNTDITAFDQPKLDSTNAQKETKKTSQKQTERLDKGVEGVEKPKDTVNKTKDSTLDASKITQIEKFEAKPEEKIEIKQVEKVEAKLFDKDEGKSAKKSDSKPLENIENKPVKKSEAKPVNKSVEKPVAELIIKADAKSVEQIEAKSEHVEKADTKSNKKKDTKPISKTNANVDEQIHTKQEDAKPKPTEKANTIVSLNDPKLVSSEANITNKNEDKKVIKPTLVAPESHTLKLEQPIAPTPTTPAPTESKQTLDSADLKSSNVSEAKSLTSPNTTQAKSDKKSPKVNESKTKTAVLKAEPPLAEGPVTSPKLVEPPQTKTPHNEDSTTKKDAKQKLSKVKSKAPQPPRTEESPAPSEASSSSASTIVEVGASSTATEQETTPILSDSKNVQGSASVQSVDAATVTGSTTESLQLNNKPDKAVATVNTAQLNANKESNISSKNIKNNENETNLKQVIKPVEASAQNESQEPSVQLLDILGPKTVTGTKPGIVAGNVRVKTAAPSKAVPVKKDATTKETGAIPKTTTTKDKKVATQPTTPAVASVKQGSPKPEVMSKSKAQSPKRDLISKQTSIKPEADKKPNITQNKTDAKPTLTPKTAPSTQGANKSPTPNAKPTAPTAKPIIPPRPNNLVSSQAHPKNSTSTSASSSNASTPSPSLYDDEEYVEYKFSPRPVFMSTICQTCKIPLQSFVHCKQCMMISYCTVEHMQEDEASHQPLCVAIQEIAKKRGGHIYNNARILNDDDYRSLRVHTLNLCENSLKRHLQPFEREILLFPRLCSTGACREWRQNLLTECKSCGQVSSIDKIMSVIRIFTYIFKYFVLYVSCYTQLS